MNAVRMREHAIAVAERALHICDRESIDALEIARRIRDSLSEREAMEKLERAKEASKMAMEKASKRMEYEIDNGLYGPTIGIEAARYSAAKAAFYAVSHHDPKKAAEQAELASAAAIAAVAYVAVHERRYPSFAIAERAATAAFKAAFEEEKRWQRRNASNS